MNATKHWSQIGEATSVSGIWFLYGVHRLLGRWPFLVCLAPVVLYYWLMHPLARQASLQYLQRIEAATGALGHVPTRRHTFRHVFAFAQTMLDKLLATAGRYPMDKVRFVGREAMHAQLVDGRGAVILTGHIGCLELCQVLARHHRDFRVCALVHTAHAERYNRIIRRLDPESRITLVQVTEISPATTLMLAEKIAAGEFVAIAGDRVPVQGGRITHADFLGHVAPFPVGPYVLASVLECPVYTMACTHADDGYEVRFESFAQRIVLSRKTRDAQFAHHAGVFAAWLQTRLGQAPYDWFNFFPFWDQAPHDVRSS